MPYEWDETKNLTNQRKHGISFETAVRVFLDPYAIEELDRYVDGEERWQMTGLIDAIHILVVAHVFRDQPNGTQTIRIISARPAERPEVGRYDRARLGSV